MWSSNRFWKQLKLPKKSSNMVLNSSALGCYGSFSQLPSGNQTLQPNGTGKSQLARFARVFSIIRWFPWNPRAYHRIFLNQNMAIHWSEFSIFRSSKSTLGIYFTQNCHSTTSAQWSDYGMSRWQWRNKTHGASQIHTDIRIVPHRRRESWETHK